MKDVAKSGLGYDNIDHPSARPVDAVMESRPYAAAAVEEDRAIAYLGETCCRCCQSDSRDMVRSPGCSEEGSCIARTTSMGMGTRSG